LLRSSIMLNGGVSSMRQLSGPISRIIYALDHIRFDCHDPCTRYRIFASRHGLSAWVPGFHSSSPHPLAMMAPEIDAFWQRRSTVQTPVRQGVGRFAMASPARDERCLERTGCGRMVRMLVRVWCCCHQQTDRDSEQAQAAHGALSWPRCLLHPLGRLPAAGHGRAAL
jgi:hypothetical protein